MNTGKTGQNVWSGCLGPGRGQRRAGTREGGRGGAKLSSAALPCRGVSAPWAQKELAVAGKRGGRGDRRSSPGDPRREPPASRDPAGVGGSPRARVEERHAAPKQSRVQSLTGPGGTQAPANRRDESLTVTATLSSQTGPGRLTPNTLEQAWKRSNREPPCLRKQSLALRNDEKM